MVSSTGRAHGPLDGGRVWANVDDCGRAFGCVPETISQSLLEDCSSRSWEGVSEWSVKSNRVVVVVKLCRRLGVEFHQQHRCARCAGRVDHFRAMLQICTSMGNVGGKGDNPCPAALRKLFRVRNLQIGQISAAGSRRFLASEKRRIDKAIPSAT